MEFFQTMKAQQLFFELLMGNTVWLVVSYVTSYNLRMLVNGQLVQRLQHISFFTDIYLYSDMPVILSSIRAEHCVSLLRSDESVTYNETTTVGLNTEMPSFRFCKYCSEDTILGAVSIRNTVLPGMAIPMLKIRRPNGRLIFNMEIAIRR